MRLGRLSVALVLLLTCSSVACNAARGALGALGELQAVQGEVVKFTGHSAVSVDLMNGQYLSVGLINSSFRGLPDADRKAKALKIATVAYRAFGSRDGLVQVRVTFVVHRSWLLIVNHTDATDAFSFPASVLKENLTIGIRAGSQTAHAS